MVRARCCNLRRSPRDRLGGVTDLQAMLADLELLVEHRVAVARRARLTTESAAAVAGGDRAPARRPPRELVDRPAGPHVHWSGGGSPKVLIVGHHDTVFPVGSAAARPFTVADGKATGPGVFDMKARHRAGRARGRRARPIAPASRS